jgi:hypothetical protein
MSRTNFVQEFVLERIIPADFEIAKVKSRSGIELCRCVFSSLYFCQRDLSLRQVKYSTGLTQIASYSLS